MASTEVGKTNLAPRLFFVVRPVGRQPIFIETKGEIAILPGFRRKKMVSETTRQARGRGHEGAARGQLTPVSEWAWRAR